MRIILKLSYNDKINLEIFTEELQMAHLTKYLIIEISTFKKYNKNPTNSSISAHFFKSGFAIKNQMFF